MSWLVYLAYSWSIKVLFHPHAFFLHISRPRAQPASASHAVGSRGSFPEYKGAGASNKPITSSCAEVKNLSLTSTSSSSSYLKAKENFIFEM
jgi:hypothetical protein